MNIILGTSMLCTSEQSAINYNIIFKLVGVVATFAKLHIEFNKDFFFFSALFSV